jgi:hypothetical protein
LSAPSNPAAAAANEVFQQVPQGSLPALQQQQPTQMQNYRQYDSAATYNQQENDQWAAAGPGY